ncbi:MAG: hypothetical protein AAF798_20115 [Bacteroidota bacterium]
MTTFRISLLLFCISLFVSVAHAQTIDPVQIVDRVYLKNGSVFQGKLLDFEYGKTVRLELSNGEVLEFLDEEITKVVQEIETGNVALPFNEEAIQESIDDKKGILKKEKVYAFKEKGIYNVTYFANLNGRNEGGIQVGFGAHHVLGYQFNRLVGVGVGFGVDTYSFGDGETVYPLSIEYRSYLAKKRLSPYVSVSAGYGFAFASEEDGIDEAQGGWMIHPAIGYRLGASKGANVVIDLGYRFQDATFTFVNEFNDSREVREQLYKRLTLRLGLLF